MKFTKPFRGRDPKGVHAKDFKPGETVPANLVKAAVAAGVTGKDTDPARMKLDDLKALAAERGIEIAEGANKEDILAALSAAEANE
jgi:hypothetical protein